MGVKFPGKKHYVTLERPMHRLPEVFFFNENEIVAKQIVNNFYDILSTVTLNVHLIFNYSVHTMCARLCARLRSLMPHGSTSICELWCNRRHPLPDQWHSPIA